MTTPRVLGAATAVLLLATTAVTTAGPATARPAAPDRSGSVTMRVDGRPAPGPSLKAGWPVGRRTGTLTTHTVPPAGAQSQNLVSVKVVQRRAPATVGATVVLKAAPTVETAARVQVAFGTLSTDGGTCTSPEGNNFIFPTIDTEPAIDNPVYDGATITVRPFVLDANPDPDKVDRVARYRAWNCAFAKVINYDENDPLVTYDAVAAAELREYIQKPMLSIVVKGRQLKPGRFTEVPIRVSNSIRTIATAPDVRLSWKPTRVTVRAPRDLGSIKPGTGRRTTFMIKRTAKGPARVTFTATSRNYRVSVTLKLEPGGRRAVG